jgi:hypothetical protein
MNVRISKRRLVRSLKWHADRILCFSRMGGGSADPAARSLEPPEGTVVLLMLPDLGVAARLCNSRFFQIDAGSRSNAPHLSPARAVLQLVCDILGSKRDGCFLGEKPLSGCALALQQLEKSYKRLPALDNFGRAAHFPWIDSPLKPCPERNPTCHPPKIHRCSLNLA